MIRRGFSLIELLVATLLMALLRGAVSLAVGALARDQRRIEARQAKPDHSAVLEQLRWDLTNSDTFTPTRDGVVLNGHGGIDRKTLAPTGRPARVTYRVRTEKDGPAVLLREQRYLDDPVRPEPWVEMVAVNVREIVLMPAEVQPFDPQTMLTSNAVPMPARLRLHIETTDGGIDQTIWTR